MKKSSLFLMLFIIVAGCILQDNSAYKYYNSYFDFEDNSESKKIYVIISRNCYSCNASLIDSLINATLQNNEYLLLISRYPHSERERKNTLILEEKFGTHFAIDSTDNCSNFENIPKNTDIVCI